MRNGLIVALAAVVTLGAGHADEPKPLSPLDRIRLAFAGAKLIERGYEQLKIRRYDDAIKTFREAIETYQQLGGGKDEAAYATSIASLAFAYESRGDFEKALPLCEQALAMQSRLNPGRDDRDLAMRLYQAAGLFIKVGQPGRARPHAERAAAMMQRLRHPALSGSLSILGHLHLELGDPDEALTCYQKALDRNRAEAKGKDDAVVAESLNSLSVALTALGQHKAALEAVDQSLAMFRRLKTSDDMSLLSALQNAAMRHAAAGDLDKAFALGEEALAMAGRLSPEWNEPTAVACLINTATLQQKRGEYRPARERLENAVAAAQRLYGDRPHPTRIIALHNLASAVALAGDRPAARPIYERALEMANRLAKAIFAAASEAEALAVVSRMPATRDDFLNVTRNDPDAAGVYGLIWSGKAAVTRLHQRRVEAARLGQLTDPALRDRWDELQAARRRLTRLLLDPAAGPARDRDLKDATERKERLERDLAARLPDVLPPTSTLGPNDLAARLTEGEAFVDLIRYADASPNKPPTLRYGAFLIAPGRGVVRVELGEAKPIDEAAAAWRKAVAAGLADDGPGRELARLVWRPIEDRLPESRRFFLAPEGELARVAFAALPGRDAGTVLLERFEFAVVPHGPFLVEQRLAKASAMDGADTVLTLGDVRYDPADRTIGRPYPELPGAARERAAVAALAAGRELIELRGGDATPAALIAALPRARYAHLATHGFFADDLLRQERQRRADWQQQSGRAGERVGVGVRNPLGYVGLVLAGANRPAADSPDAGILTGEGVVGLDLRRLKLVTLSACETGLGELTGGEGVQGLQRAFHLAGCPNVIATLWKVNDAATAALMAKFYHELWVNKKEPLAALRSAQLTIYRNPELIADLSGERGAPKVKEALSAKSIASAAERRRRADTRLWAAFVLSGVGR